MYLVGRSKYGIQHITAPMMGCCCTWSRVCRGVASHWSTRLVKMYAGGSDQINVSIFVSHLVATYDPKALMSKNEISRNQGHKIIKRCKALDMLRQVSEIIRAHPLYCLIVSNIALVFEDKMGSNTKATCEKMGETCPIWSNLVGFPVADCRQLEREAAWVGKAMSQHGADLKLEPHLVLPCMVLSFWTRS